MGVVSPIKDRDILEKMKVYLREQSFRNYLIFRIGINLGVPMNHLLNLQVEDIKGKSEFVYRGYRLPICESLQKEILFFVGDREKGLLFRSAASETPLSRFQLYNFLKDAAKKANFSGGVGSMTLRKTFAYWALQEKKIYLPLLSKYLNHHTLSYTLQYIESEGQEEVALLEMNL